MFAGPGLSSGTPDGSGHVRENKIAGLRPGHDTVEKAKTIFGRDPDQNADSRQNSWFDLCGSQRAVIAFDSNNVIQSVTVEQMLPREIVDCNDKAYSRSVRVKFGSSRGLFRGDRCERITEIYGTPDSKNISDSNRTVYVYSYDRTNQGPALTLEITCDTTINQVNSLKLAISAK
jgi:hypothetical protein